MWGSFVSDRPVRHTVKADNQGTHLTPKQLHETHQSILQCILERTGLQPAPYKRNWKKRNSEAGLGSGTRKRDSEAGLGSGTR